MVGPSEVMSCEMRFAPLRFTVHYTVNRHCKASASMIIGVPDFVPSGPYTKKDQAWLLEVAADSGESLTRILDTVRNFGPVYTVSADAAQTLMLEKLGFSIAAIPNHERSYVRIMVMH